MKYKYIWEEEDIEAGVYFIKNTSSKGSTNTGFARSVTFKIGYNNAEDKRWGRISVLTDGWYVTVAATKEEYAKWLNDNDCRPLTKEELINLIQTTEQGFIKL